MINKIRVSSYADLIKETHKSINILTAANLVIPQESWIFEAIRHAEESEKNRQRGTLEKFTSEGDVRWKTTVVFGNLSEFNFVVSQFDRLLISNNKIIIKKLREIIKMPLMVAEEDSEIGTNRGRNTLFELRLAARMMMSGLNPVLTSDHPDILLPTTGYEYAIECKRIFLENSFKRLTRKAIYQLNKYSLRGHPKRLGIVAVSITRGFHEGDLKLSAESHDDLGKLADQEIGKFVKRYSNFIHKSFTKNIPIIIFDLSDFAEGERPYWLHYLWIVGTNKKPNNPLIQSVFRDLESFRLEAGT